MLRSHSFELPTLTCVVNICSCSEIFDNQLFYLDFKDSIYKWFFYQCFKNRITFKPFNKITSTTQSFKTTFRIWVFVPKMNEVLWLWYIEFCENLNFYAKKCQNSTIFNVYKPNHNFWRENSNYPVNFSENFWTQFEIF